MIGMCLCRWKEQTNKSYNPTFYCPLKWASHSENTAMPLTLFLHRRIFGEVRICETRNQKLKIRAAILLFIQFQCTIWSCCHLLHCLQMAHSCHTHVPHQITCSIQNSWLRKLHHVNQLSDTRSYTDCVFTSTASSAFAFMSTNSGSNGATGDGPSDNSNSSTNHHHVWFCHECHGQISHCIKIMITILACITFFNYFYFFQCRQINFSTNFQCLLKAFHSSKMF